MQFNYYEIENYSDFFLHHIFEAENFSFLFSTKTIRRQKIVLNLTDKLGKLYMNRTVI